MFYDWKPEFSLDIPKFDLQHKRILFLINRLHASMEKGTGSSDMKMILDELVDYTKTHFQDEEKAMAENKYLGLEAHKMEHRKLERDVEKFCVDLAAGNAVFSGALLGFLINWLRDHIAKSDKRYATHIHGAGRNAKINASLFHVRS